MVTNKAPKNMVYLSRWLKMAQLFWRKRILKLVYNVFLLFPNYLPFEKGVALH